MRRIRVSSIVYAFLLVEIVKAMGLGKVTLVAVYIDKTFALILNEALLVGNNSHLPRFS